MKVRSSKSTDKDHRINLSLRSELPLLAVVSVILGVFCYQFVSYIFHAPFALASAVVIFFCINFIFNIGRKSYSKAYLAILLLTGFVSVGVVALAAGGYAANVLGWACQEVGVRTSCGQGMRVSMWIVALYSMVPLAILSIIALMFQLQPESVTTKKAKRIESKGLRFVSKHRQGISEIALTLLALYAIGFAIPMMIGPSLRYPYYALYCAQKPVIADGGKSRSYATPDMSSYSTSRLWGVTFYCTEQEAISNGYSRKD